MIWFILQFLRIKRKPLINTMILLYDCNLDCDHCGIATNKNQFPLPHKIFEDSDILGV